MMNKKLVLVLIGATLFMKYCLAPDGVRLVDRRADPLSVRGLFDEQHYALEDYKGQVVVIYFGAVWCPGCGGTQTP